ncbi:MAG: primosomal protein N' [Bacteroidales bacterium]|nr:primosomal protein N' [Bacteroidales bacterium]
MERETFFADVLLPLPVQGYFTYRIPYDLTPFVETGKRVIVQFGSRKIYTGLVRRIHQEIPKGNTIKYILDVMDEHPIVFPVQFAFWEWMAEYYMCQVGEVMNAALPSALKLSSETSLVLNPDFHGDTNELTDKEYLIYEALQIQQKITLSEASKIAGLVKIHPLFKSMLEKKIVIPEEELQDPYRPKIVDYVHFNPPYLEGEKLEKALSTLEKKAFKQLEILMNLIHLSGYFSKNHVPVKKSVLLKKSTASAAQLKALEQKNIIEIRKVIESRLPKERASATPEEIILNEAQQVAHDQITQGFEKHPTLLLHGITGSGKTELYIKQIARVLQEGRQVLFLLPEIALTTQIILRLEKYFGERVGVYHSRYNLNERAEIWHRINKKADNSYAIILGARSAIFLPFINLGLIIVDEEHDYSYKQMNPAPRYNARDAAIWLAQKHNAHVLLGSATPCIETYYNCRSGKYGLIDLKKRYGGLQLPEVQVADLRLAKRKKDMHGDFSDILLKHIDEALQNKEQVILFQNKRGFSRRLECETCGWIPQCVNCDVSLIYHKHFNQLRCHYCGFHTPIPSHCPECGSPSIIMKGFGTEKIEEELSIIYPNYRIERMDMDTTRSKFAYQRIIKEFEEQKIDILVGTQMVTKGLDFDNVSLVGILSADSLINFPDFRSFERSYQLMAQVSGRAGRKKKQGKVIIQTYNPNHAAIKLVIENDFLTMYTQQIIERKNYNYPPFYRLIHISLRHKDPQILNHAAALVASTLRTSLGKRVLGPEYPMVTRIRNLYIKQIIVKIERGPEFTGLRHTLQGHINAFEGLQEYKSVKIAIDVDPY